MVEISIHPEEMVAGAPQKAKIQLSNPGPQPVYHVDARFRWPRGLTHLRGPASIAAKRISPGNTVTTQVVLHAREAGTYPVTTRNSSCCDAMGRVQPLDISFEVTAKPAPAPSQSAPRSQNKASEDPRPVDMPSATRNGPSPATYDVFISYSRNRIADLAGRVFERLASHYGRDRVFFDQSRRSNPLGQSFPDTLKRSLLNSRVVVLLIDASWKQKISEPVDPNENWVLLEAEYALHHQCVCLPVFVNGEPMLDREMLPPNLRTLRLTNAAELNSSSFERDIKEVVEALDRALAAR